MNLITSLTTSAWLLWSLKRVTIQHRSELHCRLLPQLAWNIFNLLQWTLSSLQKATYHQASDCTLSSRTVIIPPNSYILCPIAESMSEIGGCKQIHEQDWHHSGLTARTCEVLLWVVILVVIEQFSVSLSGGHMNRDSLFMLLCLNADVELFRSHTKLKLFNLICSNIFLSNTEIFKRPIQCDT